MVKDQLNPKFEDSLFIYTNSSRWILPTPKWHDTSIILDYEHDDGGVGDPKLGPNLETNVKDKQPLEDKKWNGNDDYIEDDDYNDLILKLDHFEKGEISKGKSISCAKENLALFKYTLCDVVREA